VARQTFSAAAAVTLVPVGWKSIAVNPLASVIFQPGDAAGWR